jgi:hypothetical protein
MLIKIRSLRERQEERVKLLEEAFREIERSGLGALAQHVMGVMRAMRRHMPTKWRVPYGLAAEQDGAPGTWPGRSFTVRGGRADPRIAEGEEAMFLTQPQVTTRFTHLVVTEDTAQHFDLEDYKIGKNSQLFDRLDLTLFSMKYQACDELSDLFTFPSDVAQVSQIVSLRVKRKKDGHGPKRFTGILWAEFDF